MTIIATIPKFLDNSNDVKILQQKLADSGFNPGVIDGIFGFNTKRALINFQLANDLIGDGIIGNKTMAALGFLLARPKHDNGFMALSWELKDPTTKSWSDYVFQQIENHFAKFSLCEDITLFRPDYESLTQQQKVNVWGELICAICKYESGWKPWSAMIETTMKTDPVTGKQVRSEGLMQLSYQDQRNYPMLTCHFDWDNDKNLAENDVTKTIFDPFINLEFGIQILARQIERRQAIALSEGVYWAVLKLNGRYSKLPEIIQMVKTLNF